MTADWLFDHFGWFVGALIAVLAGVIVWALLNGGMSCPKHQHAVLLYQQPIVVSTGKSTTVTMVPVYGCES